MAAKKTEENTKTLNKKWGADVTDLGWTAVPNILIERQQALKLTPIELNLILILLKYWWDISNPPYPSKRAIGEMLGREESTIRKTFSDLEKRGLIERGPRYMSRGGQTTNHYLMDGLVEKLKQEATNQKSLKKSRAEEDASIRRGNDIAAAS